MEWFSPSHMSRRTRQFQRLICRSLLLAATLVCLTPSALAVVKVSSVLNASKFTDTNNTYTLFGGTAGPTTSTTTGSLFNSCAAQTTRFGACNENRIYGNLIVSFTFTAERDGRPLIAVSNGTTSTTLTPEGAPPTSLAKGTAVTLSVRWGAICAAMSTTTTTLSGDCEISGLGVATGKVLLGVSGGTSPDTDLDDSTDDETANVSVIISNSIGQTGNSASGESIMGRCDDDVNATGLCHFEVGPGDEKVVLRHLEGRNGFPVVSNGIYYERLRLMWVESPNASGDNAALSQFTTNMPDGNRRDVDISASTGQEVTVSPTRIEGLSNDTRYIFKVAVIDSAGNIGYFTSDTAFNYCDFADNRSSCHATTPGEVVGVLAQDVNCFVATAAYGSAMAPQVEVFRQFRDRFLKPTAWGRRFVAAYYQHAPKYAQIIAARPVLRFLSRGLLWPLLGYASLSLQFGAGWAACVLLLGIVTAACFTKASLRRRSHDNS